MQHWCSTQAHTEPLSTLPCRAREGAGGTPRGTWGLHPEELHRTQDRLQSRSPRLAVLFSSFRSHCLHHYPQHAFSAKKHPEQPLPAGGNYLSTSKASDTGPQMGFVFFFLHCPLLTGQGSLEEPARVTGERETEKGSKCILRHDWEYQQLLMPVVSPPRPCCSHPATDMLPLCSKEQLIKRCLYQKLAETFGALHCIITFSRVPTPRSPLPLLAPSLRTTAAHSITKEGVGISSTWGTAWSQGKVGQTLRPISTSPTKYKKVREATTYRGQRCKKSQA